VLKKSIPRFVADKLAWGIIKKALVTKPTFILF